MKVPDAPAVLANIVGKKGGGIMPLGGNKEVNGSHKGYGYGMLCEIFSSILSMGVTSDKCCTFTDKTGICHGFVSNRSCNLRRSRRYQDAFLRISGSIFARVRRPKVQSRFILTVRKKFMAEKERRENGIPVNDNTMVELANLCNYLKTRFWSLF